VEHLKDVIYLPIHSVKLRSAIKRTNALAD
jgi:hypothetical protein